MEGHRTVKENYTLFVASKSDIRESLESEDINARHKTCIMPEQRRADLLAEKDQREFHQKVIESDCRYIRSCSPKSESHNRRPLLRILEAGVSSTSRRRTWLNTTEQQ